MAIDVLHVCYGGFGGHQAVINSLVREFNARRISSGVIGVAPVGTEFADESSWNEIRYLRKLQIRSRLSQTWLIAIYREVRALQPRVVILHTHRPALFVLLAFVAAGRWPRVVMVEHHAVNLRTFADNLNSLISLACSKYIIFLSPKYVTAYPLRSWLRLMGKKWSVIPTGVDVTRYARRRKAARPPCSVRVVGTATRLVPGKDLDTLLHGFALLQKDIDDACLLLIAGDGIEKQKFMILADELGITSSVVFLGVIPEPAMPDFYAALDIYVLSTLGETLNTSILQAAASRVPVVATRVPGITDVLTDQVHANLVTPRDAKALALALKNELSSGGHSPLVESAFERVEKNFSCGSMAASYLKTLSEVDPKGPWRKALRFFPATCPTAESRSSTEMSD